MTSWCCGQDAAAKSEPDCRSHGCRIWVRAQKSSSTSSRPPYRTSLTFARSRPKDGATNLHILHPVNRRVASSSDYSPAWVKEIE